MGMEHYTKIRDLNGSTEVFLAADKQNPAKRVVIKRLADDAQGMEELSVSVRVQHPNIVKFLESFVHEGGLYVVTHYERGGDLESLLSRLTTLAKKPTRSTLLHWFQQLLSAVSFCHAQHVIHRDIKPGNIFLSHDTKDVFVGDFGSAKKLSPSSAMTSTFAGSPMWLSPEVLMGTPYTFSSDMWSLGCVLYEMASLHRPFSATSFARLVQQVTAGEVAPLPATVPEDVQRLIMEMLVVDPQQRIDAESALKRVEEAIAREPAVVVKKKATANNNNNNNNKKSGGGGGGGNAQPPPPTHVPPRAQAAAARHGDRQPTSRPVSPERLPSSPSKNNNNNNNNAHIFFDKPVTKQGSGSLPNRTPHPLLGHTKAPQDERRGGSAGGTTTTTSRSSTTEGNTARPGQWMDARARDVSVIEKYLHKFREHDDEVLHSYNEKTGMLNAVFAKNNNNNNGRRTSLSGSSLGLGSPNARRARSPHNRSPAVSAPRRVVAPTTSGAVVVKREPSTSSAAHNNKNVVATKEPPQRVVSKHVSRPVEKVVGAPPPPVSVAVLRKPPPPPPPAPTSAAAVAVPRKRRGDGLERGHVIESINFSRQTSNLSNHSITPAHQPRQASHARPVRQLTSAEQKRAEEQRSKAREQREGERNKMVEMIRERRAEAAKKKAVNVSIMLPDKLQYTEDGIQKVDG